eukprot:g36405.t1
MEVIALFRLLCIATECLIKVNGSLAVSPFASGEECVRAALCVEPFLRFLQRELSELALHGPGIGQQGGARLPARNHCLKMAVLRPSIVHQLQDVQVGTQPYTPDLWVLVRKGADLLVGLLLDLAMLVINRSRQWAMEGVISAHCLPLLR